MLLIDISKCTSKDKLLKIRDVASDYIRDLQVELNREKRRIEAINARIVELEKAES